MIFVNPTAHSALLLRTVLDPQRMLASVVVRTTYALAPRLIVADEQPWKVSPEPWDSPVGKMEEDGPFLRGGVDLFVFGHAWAPHGSTTSMRVQVRAGRFMREAVVTGRRVWVRSGMGLVASDPEPFSTMPLTMAEAYGGKSEADGLEIPCGDNPMGKGFHVTAEQALGKELPNIEEPHAPMQRWNDTPPVCGLGLCPRANAARVLNGTVRDEQYNILDLRPQFFNQAFVPMIAPTLAPGELVELIGFSRPRALHFAIPAPPASVRLTLGEQVIERPLVVDQVGIEVDAARVFITWRFPFRYVVRERQERLCELIEVAAS